MGTEVPEANVNFPQSEEEVLKLLEELDAFHTSLKQSKGKPKFSFYDGPPLSHAFLSSALYLLLTETSGVKLPLLNTLVILKDEVRQFFYWPQTEGSLNRQFSPKSPKVGQSSGQSVRD